MEKEWADHDDDDEEEDEEEESEEEEEMVIADFCLFWWFFYITAFSHNTLSASRDKQLACQSVDTWAKHSRHICPQSLYAVSDWRCEPFHY